MSNGLEDTREDFLLWVLTTIIECNSSGYWGDFRNIERVEGGEMDLCVSSFEVREYDRDSEYLPPEHRGEWIKVDGAKIEEGFSKLQEPGFKIGAKTRGNILQASVRNDAGDIDAGDGDLILQAAVLGELVYG